MPTEYVSYRVNIIIFENFVKGLWGGDLSLLFNSPINILIFKMIEKSCRFKKLSFCKRTVFIKFAVSLTIVNDVPSLAIFNDDPSLTIVNDGHWLTIVKEERNHPEGHLYLSLSSFKKIPRNFSSPTTVYLYIR